MATLPGSSNAAPVAAQHKPPAKARPVSREAARLAALRNLAPADEYFGQLKMSILGIKNTIKDLGLRYDINHDIAKQTIASAALTEGAIRDWEHKYPKDREVPRAMYFLQRLYAHIVYDQAQMKAKATAQWLFSDYPGSPQARLLKNVIASATPMPTDAPSAAPAVAAPPAAAPPAEAPPATAPSATAPVSPAAPPLSEPAGPVPAPTST